MVWRADVKSSGLPADKSVGDAPHISADGRFVVYSTSADMQMYAIPDTNNESDIFKYSIDTGDVRLISVTPDGQQVGNGRSLHPSISYDGDVVTFSSSATNFTNQYYGTSGNQNVFVRDLPNREMKWLSQGEERPPAPSIPANVTVPARGETWMQMQWTDTSIDETRWEVMYSQMLHTDQRNITDYHLLKDADWQFPNFNSSTMTQSGNQLSFQLQNLKAATPYIMLVRSCSSNGCSAYSAPFIWTTQYPPGQVQQKAQDSSVLAASQSEVKRHVLMADPVNTIFGNFYYKHTDLQMPGIGPNIALTRSYNSANPQDGLLGWGWNVTNDLRITWPDADHVAVKHGDGRVDTFARTSSGWEGPPGSVDRLVITGDAATRTRTYTLSTRERITYVFNDYGRLKSAADSDGNIARFSYSGSQWTGVTDASARTWKLDYTGTGNRIHRITDPSGRTVTYAYDASGNLISVTNAAGGVTHYGYDSHHRLTDIYDPRGTRSLHMAYEDVVPYNQPGVTGVGRVIRQDDARGTHKFAYFNGYTVYTDPFGKPTTTHYDSKFNITKKVDALGNTMSWTFDNKGQVMSETDALGRVTKYTYDARGNRLSTRNALGGVSSSTYDARDNLLSVADPLGRVTKHTYDPENHRISTTNAHAKVTTWAYDARGLQTSLTNVLGKVTRWTYDMNGNRTSVTDTLGRITRFTVDSAGRVASESDPLNQVKRTSYNPLNLVLTQTAPDGGVTTYTYDAAGNKTSVKDPKGNTTTYTYNAANDLVSERNALGQTTTYTYDRLGQQVRQTLANGTPWITAYDAIGRKVSETTPLGLVTRHGYDRVGNLTSVTLPNGKVTRYGYDALNRLVSVTDALGGISRYTYDAVGNQTSATDAMGRKTNYTYDKLNWLTKEATAANTITKVYDTLGRITRETRARVGTTTGQQATSYTYDAMDRVLSKTSGTTVTRYTYDAVGNRTTMKHGASTSSTLPTTTYTYDVASRVKKVASPQGTVSHTYDRAGNRISMAQAGLTTNYTYDALNRLSSVKRGMASTEAYAYNNVGLNTTQSSGNGLVTVLTYDSDGRLLSLTTKNGTTTLSSTNYTLDKLGNRTKETNRGFTGSYTYDALSRLTGATVSVSTAGGARTAINRTYSYTYDKVGNRLRETVNGVVKGYVYNGANQLTSVGGKAVTYDAAGRIISDGASTYAYDAFGRLARVKTGTVITAFTYDGDDNRVSEKVGTILSTFLLDTTVPNAQRIATTSGTTITRHVYGLQRVGSFTNTGIVRYEHADGLGSVRMVSTGTKGVTYRANYEPFGTRLNGAGVFGFAGEAYGANGVLVHLRAREYNPTLGRFLSTDPVGAIPVQPQSYNLYSYVGNNPMNVTDPSGELCFSLECIGAGFQAAGQAIAGAAQAVGSAVQSGVNSVGSALTRPVNTVTVRPGEITASYGRSLAESSANKEGLQPRSGLLSNSLLGTAVGNIVVIEGDSYKPSKGFTQVYEQNFGKHPGGVTRPPIAVHEPQIPVEMWDSEPPVLERLRNMIEGNSTSRQSTGTGTGRTVSGRSVFWP